MREEPFSGEFGAIAALIEERSRFLMVGHVDPDGDCIGSMLAIAQHLVSRGREVVCYTPGEIADVYRSLPRFDLLVPAERLAAFEPEVVIAVDSPTTARTADFVRHGGKTIVVNIDHHPTNERYGDINVVDERASATALLAYRLLAAIAPAGITPAIADCLYLGVLMDTGGFRFQNTNAESLAAAATFVELGAHPYQLAHEYIYVKKLSTLRILARALDSIEIHGGRKIALMEITREMLLAARGELSETEGFVDYAASVDDVELAALFREIGPGEIRVSLRSRNGYDVASLAERYGGGGHRNAAGLTVHRDLVSAKGEILRGLEALLSLGGGSR
jgi:phosphoesterase RecJ-like protein